MNFQLPDEVILKVASMLEDVKDRQFEIGDYLAEVVDFYDGKVTKNKIYTEISRNIGVDSKTLYAYESTARKWTPEYRQQYKKMDWTFYKEVDPNDDKQRELIDQAIDENMNVTSFMREKYPQLKKPVYMLNQAISILNNVIKIHWDGDTKGISEEVFMLIYGSLEKLYLAEEEQKKWNA